MTKAIAEQSNALNIFSLKEYLTDGCHRTGTSTWTSGTAGNKNSIGFEIVIDKDKSYIRLSYTHTNQYTKEKEDLDYKIKLTTTPCNYGGRRYWFICTLSKDGVYCGRRVGVIYLIGKYFGCRYCGNIAYLSQMQGGANKGFVSIPDIEKAEEEIKRYYYKGKPTRKHRKLIRLNEKFELSLAMMAAKIHKPFARLIKGGKIGM